MGLPRSTYYDEPSAAADDTAVVEAIARICDAFETSMATGAWARLCGRPASS